MEENQSPLEEIQFRIKTLGESLPKVVDPAALGVKSKAPYKLLCVREALIWRTEELARTAYQALDRGDYAASAILTRAILENVALVWRLVDAIESRSNYTPHEFDDFLMRLLLGSKQWSEFPDPINVLTLVDRLEKKASGFREIYDDLSEFAHPNWSGTAGLYSTHNQSQIITCFGRKCRGKDSTQRKLGHGLLGALIDFELGYNRIADLMPLYIAELEKF